MWIPPRSHAEQIGDMAELWRSSGLLSSCLASTTSKRRHGQRENEQRRTSQESSPL